MGMTFGQKPVAINEQPAVETKGAPLKNPFAGLTRNPVAEPMRSKAAEKRESTAVSTGTFSLPGRAAAIANQSNTSIDNSNRAGTSIQSPANALKAALAATQSAPSAVSIGQQPQSPSAALSEAISAQEFQHPTQPNIFGPATEEQFKKNLELLHGVFPNKDLIAPVIKKVLMDLNEHPEFEQFMAPKDIGAMVTLLRSNYRSVVALAEERKAKTGKKKKDQPSIDLSDLNSLLV